LIDINTVRNDPKLVKENIKKKFQDQKLPLVDEVIKIDSKLKALRQEAQDLRTERNAVSLQINEAKKSGKDVKKILEKAKKIPDQIKEIEDEALKLDHELVQILNAIPNIMNKSVPIGKDASQNKELKKIGKPKKYKYEIKNHAELAENLGMADFDSSRKTSGAAFYYLESDLALLNQALIRFAIDRMTSHGFRYVETPLLVRSEVINNVTELNDQKAQIYKIEDEDLFLIGTSEHALIGRFIDTTMPESRLPIKQTSYSMCFRKEKGSHGLDERGLFRTHQFNKVEMVVICRPQDSMKYFEEIQNATIDIFKSLEIPIRTLAICSGDLGDMKHCQVDIEAWSPRKNEYFEIGSCSNLTDAQSIKLKIRTEGKNGKYYPHTLNNTAIATSRAMVAILENNQNADGSVTIPEALIPYMNGKTKITRGA
jgi:seryl-tRNA synthetase